MVFFVVSGKSITFTLKLSGAPAATKVTFKKKDGGEVVSEVTVAEDAFDPLEEGGRTVQVAQYRFAAPTLDAEERELDVVMTHDQQPAAAKPIAIKVFRDTLKVKVVQAGVDGAPVSCSGVKVSVKVAANQDWMDSRRLKAWEFPPKHGETGQDGVATIAGLPYGGLTLELHSEGVSLEELAKGGDTWTAKIKSSVVAKLISPAPLAAGAPPHKQWVNLDAVKANIQDPAIAKTFGSLVKVQVRAELLGTPLPHRTVWLAALFGEGNSPRTGLPRPGLKGAVAEGKLKIASQASGADGIATFELELGVAGGDEVRLFVGGSKDVSEAKNEGQTAIVTWRRLELRPQKLSIVPPGSNPKADVAALQAKIDSVDTRIDPESCAKVKEELAKAFVDTVWTEPETLLLPEKMKKYLAVVGGTDDPADPSREVAKRLKLDPDRKNLLWTDSSGPQGGLGPFEFYPPRMLVIPVHRIVYKKAAPTWTFTLSFMEKPPAKDPHADEQPEAGAVRKVSNIRSSIPLPNTSGGFFLQQDWNGQSAVMDWKQGQFSYWQEDGSDEQKRITHDFLQIDPKEESQNLIAKLKVPENVRPQKSVSAKVCLKLQTYGVLAGDTSSNRMTITVARPPPALDEPEKRQLRVAYTLLHEIAHAMQIAVKSPSANKVGPEETNPLWYERPQKDGPHCMFGVKKPEEKPWNVTGSTVSGECCLYSPVHAKTPYETATKLCPTCAAHMKAANFGLAPTEVTKQDHNTKQYETSVVIRSDMGGYR